MELTDNDIREIIIEAAEWIETHDYCTHSYFNFLTPIPKENKPSNIRHFLKGNDPCSACMQGAIIISLTKRTNIDHNANYYKLFEILNHISIKFTKIYNTFMIVYNDHHANDKEKIVNKLRDFASKI